MMTDDASTLRMLYSCYSYIQTRQGLVFSGEVDGGGSDEVVQPQEWGNIASMLQWNAVTPSSINDRADYPWNIWYAGIGYCNLFLKLIDDLNPVLNPADREQYIAEAKFLKAYYHFQLLQLYGPIPIIDQFMPADTPKADFPGRFHYDYCVQYITNLLDEAAVSLPVVYPNQMDFGRATSVICKAIKARCLVMAASPMWNGNFPIRTWKNNSFETPGYGTELVSRQYDPQKWVNARDAVREAIDAAVASGAELFDIEVSEGLRANQDTGLPLIPGLSELDSKTLGFKKRVMMLRYLTTARPDDGNKELIWGVTPIGNVDDYQTIMSSLPHYVMINNQGNQVRGWGGLSPTWRTVIHFFTENGRLPAEDPTFCEHSEYLQSAGLSNPDIIKVNVHREPRFYAWISFDGDQYSTTLANGSPVFCDFKDNTTTGYDAAIHGTRNYCVTGFLNKKHVHPNFMWTGAQWSNNFNSIRWPIPLIRLGEIYLEMAECEAQLGNKAEALNYLNKIRQRAGVPEWTEATLAETGKNLVDAILEERFVECYMEGYRYFDMRRYLKCGEVMTRETFSGLNAVSKSPSFKTFNTLVNVAQPFNWNNRMYLLPISNKEIYSNPNMVQAPGY